MLRSRRQRETITKLSDNLIVFTFGNLSAKLRERVRERSQFEISQMKMDLLCVFTDLSINPAHNFSAEASVAQFRTFVFLAY